MSTIDYLLNGLATSFTWYNLAFVFMGVLIGTVVGVLPGIGPMSGVALLIPITATMTAGMGPEASATSSIILLAGVYYGAMYGGSTTSILLNTPGESSSVVTTLDGYQMAKQGRAGAALSIAAIGSFVAGLVSLIGLIFLAQPLSELAIKFGPAEYFSLMVLGLFAISGLAGKSMIKALMMTATGLLLATIGIDNVSGVARFTYGIPQLYQGLEFLTVAVGMFALGEVFKTILHRDSNDGELAKINRVMPTKQDLASFFSYIVEKKISKNPEKFGKGAIEGVAAPESANNAAAGSAMIPLLTLGIPSSGTTAIMMGAFIMYNIQPGPLLFTDHPDLAWGVIASMFVGNLMLLILNMPLVRVFAKVIETPTKYLIPLIVVFSVFGVYAIQYSTFDLMLIMGCGVAGYYLNKNDYPLAPLVLGLILGPMMENNMRRALTISNGDFMIFLQKPISLAFLFVGLLWLVIPLILKLKGKKVLINEEA
jgi:putative tricarboxylic transport membrane protein